MSLILRNEEDFDKFLKVIGIADTLLRHAVLKGLHSSEIEYSGEDGKTKRLNMSVEEMDEEIESLYEFIELNK